MSKNDIIKWYLIVSYIYIGGLLINLPKDNGQTRYQDTLTLLVAAPVVFPIVVLLDIKELFKELTNQGEVSEAKIIKGK